jgi:hypothetical protein
MIRLLEIPKLSNPKLQRWTPAQPRSGDQERVTPGDPPWSKREAVAAGYLRAAQAYMLISMPTGTSTIFGVFQAILALLVHRIADRTNSVLTNKLIPFKKFATKIFAGGVCCAAKWNSHFCASAALNQRGINRFRVFRIDPNAD